MSFFNRSRFFSHRSSLGWPNLFRLSIGAPLVLAAVCAAALLFGLPGPLYSAVDGINTVTNNNDSGPGSLRAVIAASNNGDIVVFDPSVVGAISLTSGELTITKSLTIIGPGKDILAIDGNNTSRVLSIESGSNVTLGGLTIQNGNSGAYGGGIYSAGSIEVFNGAIVSNTADFGGGIFIESNIGRLAMSNSSVVSNTASAGFGGGIALGAGAQALGISGTMQITNSTISANTAAGRGGGIFSSGPVTLIGSVVSRNSGVMGGGIDAGTLTVSDSSILENSAIDVNDAQRQAQPDATEPSSILATGGGGGINSAGGVVSVSNSTIASNTADSSGGGIAISGTLTINNSTISSNGADLLAGAIANKGGTMAISFTTIVSNVSLFQPAGIAVVGQANLNSTLLANQNNSNCVVGGAGTIVSAGFNLESGNTCGLNATGDLTNRNPLIGPLANNGPSSFDSAQDGSGQSTLTHALFFGSPAIDAGDNFGCPTTDQRGVPRPQGPRCDIGAFEAWPPVVFLPIIARQSPPGS
jgi:hypothetical protein